MQFQNFEDLGIFFNDLWDLKFPWFYWNIFFSPSTQLTFLELSSTSILSFYTHGKDLLWKPRTDFIGRIQIKTTFVSLFWISLYMADNFVRIAKNQIRQRIVNSNRAYIGADLLWSICRQRSFVSVEWTSVARAKQNIRQLYPRRWELDSQPTIVHLLLLRCIEPSLSFLH